MMDDSTKQAISEAGSRAFTTIEKVFLARLYREPTCIDAFLVIDYMSNLIHDAMRKQALDEEILIEGEKI